MRYGQFTATINELMQFGADLPTIKQYLNNIHFTPVSEDEIKRVLQEINKIPYDFDGIFAKVINTQMAFISSLKQAMRRHSIGIIRTNLMKIFILSHLLASCYSLLCFLLCLKALCQ